MRVLTMPSVGENWIKSFVFTTRGGFTYHHKLTLAIWARTGKLTDWVGWIHIATLPWQRQMGDGRMDGASYWSRLLACWGVQQYTNLLSSISSCWCQYYRVFNKYVQQYTNLLSSISSCWWCWLSILKLNKVRNFGIKYYHGEYNGLSAKCIYCILSTIFSCQI